jgi:hypothetical protein
MFEDRMWDVEDRDSCESVGESLDCFDLRMFPIPPRPVTRGEVNAVSRLCCSTTSFSAARTARVSNSDMRRFDALADVVLPAPPLPIVELYKDKCKWEALPKKDTLTWPPLGTDRMSRPPGDRMPF